MKSTCLAVIGLVLSASLARAEDSLDSVANNSSGLGMGVIGLIVAFILFVIGLVWIIFPFIVNSWFKKVHRQLEESTAIAEKLAYETTRGNELLAQLLAHAKKGAAAPAAVQIPAPPAPASYAPTLTISKDGENIGEHTLTNVKQMLKRGELTMQDLYFDDSTQEWSALDLHPALY